MYYSTPRVNALSMENITKTTLDTILALQVTVAWAGEGLCEPKRLDWWRTDLIDPDGGGYLFRELFPKTHQWASLEAARKMAIALDKRMRQDLASADGVRTLFFWGFPLDERLDERLGEHKRDRKSPADVLPLPIAPGSQFTRSDFEAAVRVPKGAPGFRVTPGGREIEGAMPDSLESSARNLAAALLPLTDRYPLPFYRLERA
jgi:hypothetical protein